MVGRAALQQVLGTAEAQARNGLSGALEEDARLTALFLWTLQSTAPVAENQEQDDETDEEAVAKAAATGFALPFDVVRRFAQPMGIDLDTWTDRIIGQEKGVVRLLPVSERAKKLFGEDGAAAAANHIESDPHASLQQTLFPDYQDGAPSLIREPRPAIRRILRRPPRRDSWRHHPRPRPHRHATPVQRPRQRAADANRRRARPRPRLPPPCQRPIRPLPSRLQRKTPPRRHVVGGAEVRTRKEDLMDQITLKNFRCFRETQTARLAPLTLLVGENSTGKTSFMALIRILCDTAHYGLRTPDFKEEPYDMGSFDEIAHHCSTRGGRANTFKAGFTYSKKYKSRFQNVISDEPFKFEIEFGQQDTVPIPVRRYIAWAKTRIEETFEQGKLSRVGVGTSRGEWERQVSIDTAFSFDPNHPAILPFFGSLTGLRESVDLNTGEVEFVPISGSPELTTEDCKELELLAFSLHGSLAPEWRPFASAPVRSKPRRTYDPSRPTPDPEGNNVPMYLASMYFHDKT